ncbi:MAG: OmpA family protein [Proteobacteria bacterium]|nr:OmpA family protein [Pseudomonadota bacterium]MBU6426471.1 OmpA family protein [Rhodospirillales bacterium]
MKKLLILGILMGLGGCASLDAPSGPPPPATPVFFQPFSAALDQAALNAIATAAQAANAQPDAPVTVIGAADSVGSVKANEYLSETRAQVVADQLAADGVAQSRLRIRARGIIQPTLEAPGTPVQAARRVLIEIGGD